MKVNDYSKLQKFNPYRLEKPIRQVYEEINASCNNFLRTQKGLQYLLTKYPTLTVEQAIREYYSNAWICETYDGTDF